MRQEDETLGPRSPARRQALRQALGMGAGAALARIGQAMPPAEAPILRPVPHSGERLPAVGLGTWQSFDVARDAAERASAREVLRRFAAGGGRVIDASPMYGSAEAMVGELAAELGVGEKLFHATKVWTRGREAGMAQMEESFRRMRVTRMDLMQVHNLVDADTHLPTLRAWQAQGRIRYIGLTHYHAGAYEELERLLGREKPDFVQLNYSLAEREAERRLLPLAAELGVAVLVNRPYAEGALFRDVRGKPLPDFAAAIGAASWEQFFLKWNLGHPAVTCAIPATRNPEHVIDNLGAARGVLPDAALRRRMAAYLETV